MSEIKISVGTIFKAGAAMFVTGVISFVGTWAVGLSDSVAKLKEDVAVLKEKEQFLAPWLVTEVNEVKADLKEVRKLLTEKQQREDRK